MDDKCLMENILMVEKGVCDLYLHGTIESNTQNVHAAFDNALEQSLQMQDAIYKRWRRKAGIPQSRPISRRFKR